MPNWVTNKFQYVSDESKLRQVACDSEGNFDFNILIPIPYMLNIRSMYFGERYIEGVNIIKDIINSDTIKRTPIDVLMSNCLKELEKLDETTEVKMNLILRRMNELKLDDFDWYNWSINNWGTKWNATKVDEYTFDTAWATPKPWLEKLAQHIDFVLWFADEDLGSNLGYITARSGNVEICYLDETEGFEDYKTRMLIALVIKEGVDNLTDLETKLAEWYEWTEEEIAEAKATFDGKLSEFIKLSGADKVGVC